MSDFDNGFDFFWDAYPKKTAKKDAARAFAKAIKKVSLETIMEALCRDCESEQWSRHVIPHAATWLNGERWNDQRARRLPQDVMVVTQGQIDAVDQAITLARRRAEMTAAGMTAEAISQVFEDEYNQRQA